MPPRLPPAPPPRGAPTPTVRGAPAPLPAPPALPAPRVAGLAAPGRPVRFICCGAARSGAPPGRPWAALPAGLACCLACWPWALRYASALLLNHSLSWGLYLEVAGSKLRSGVGWGGVGDGASQGPRDGVR
jgi:hypothetical protein